MNKMLKDAWDIVQQKPGLYNIPLFFFFISDLLFQEWNVFNICIFIIFSIVVNTGWIYQIKEVLNNKDNKKVEKPKFEDFLIGIGKYFNVIISGSVFLFIGVLLAMVIASGVIDYFAQAAQPDIEKIRVIKNEILKYKNTEEVITYLSTIEPKIQRIFVIWTTGIFSFFSIIGVIYFFLGLWSYLVIIKENKFIEACKNSLSLVIKKLGIYTVITGIYSLYWVFSSLGKVFFIAQDNFFGLFLLLVIGIFSDTYINVLLCLFVNNFESGVKEADAIQSKPSEI